MPFRTDRLSEIERKLDELQKENAELKRKIESDMKRDSICPRCFQNEVIYSPSVLDSDSSGRSQMAITQPSLWKSKRVGSFEVYVCAGCGFADWYVKDVKALQKELSAE